MADQYKNRLYRIWHSMRSRCNNPNNRNYHRYGGRGITCQDSWSKYCNFEQDMLESYNKHVKEFEERETTIDRIDNDGNYCKDNVRWATHKEQQNNMSRNSYITCPDGRFTLSQVSDNYNILYSTIKSRYYQYGDNYKAVVLGDTDGSIRTVSSKDNITTVTTKEKESKYINLDKELYKYWITLKHNHKELDNEDWYNDYNLFSKWSLNNNYVKGKYLTKIRDDKEYELDNYSYVDRLGYTVSIGDRYNEWEVISNMFESGLSKSCKVRCKCGKETTVAVRDLVNGNTKMCKSCSALLRTTTHGMTGTKIYSTWKNIKQRTNTVCDRWKDSFETFYKDTHEEYDRLMGLYDKSEVRFILLDRKGIYEPNNCKWIARVKK